MTSLLRIDRGDLVAGVTVALLLVPQAMAYADIAGVPSIVGLYAAAIPPIAAAAFVSSPYLQTGPTAMTALLTFGALGGLAEPFSPEYLALASLLALVVGVVRVLVGITRVGVIAYFMSQPVLLGFTSAAALLIVASQIPSTVGLEKADGSLVSGAIRTVTSPGAWHWESVAVSAATAIVLVIGRRLAPRLPIVLFVVVAATLYSSITDFPGATVGSIPAALPFLTMSLPWSKVASLAVPGLVIALVGFAEPASIARSFATKDRARWSPDQEFISQGVANLASGLVGGIPVGGSFARSSVNRLAGAKTKWSGAITGIVVVALLPLVGVLSPLPTAVLGVIVITAVVQLVRPDQVVGLVRRSIPQGLVAIITFVATLLLSPRIDLAVLLGIALGTAVHIWRELTTHIRTDYSGRTLTLIPSGVLFFASAQPIADEALDQLVLHPETQNLRIVLSELGRVDYTGAMALKAIADEATSAGLNVTLDSVPRHAIRILNKVLDTEVSSDHTWSSRPQQDASGP